MAAPRTYSPPAFDGLAVAQLRRGLGLTQAELAERASCSPDMVHSIELLRATPSVALLTRLAAALDVPVGELFRAGAA